MRIAALVTILALCGCAGSRQAPVSEDRPRLLAPYCAGLAGIPLFLAQASIYGNPGDVMALDVAPAPADMQAGALAYIAKQEVKP